MSRRVPALATLVAMAAFQVAAQNSLVTPTGSTPAMLNPQADPAGGRPEGASAVLDSLLVQSGDIRPVRPRMIIFPIDSFGTDSTLAREYLDSLVQEIANDSVDHGTLEKWTSQVATLAEAESLGRGENAQSILWMQLVGRDSGRKALLAQRRCLSPDSVIAQGEYLFSDSTDSFFVPVPRTVLLGLFPRPVVISPPPPPPRPPVALTDSVKPVAVFMFVAEGTAMPEHAASFTDSMMARLKGMDGFRILSAKVRDSLLAGWDPGECLTSSCRREAGERLGTPWIIAGRLVQLGEKWSVHAELVRVDSGTSARTAIVQCQGAPVPAMKLAAGMTARQLAGLESPREQLSDAPVARAPAGPVWRRILALSIATTLGLVGVVLSW